MAVFLLCFVIYEAIARVFSKKGEEGGKSIPAINDADKNTHSMETYMHERSRREVISLRGKISTDDGDDCYDDGYDNDDASDDYSIDFWDFGMGEDGILARRTPEEVWRESALPDSNGGEEEDNVWLHELAASDDFIWRRV